MFLPYGFLSGALAGSEHPLPAHLKSSGNLHAVGHWSSQETWPAALEGSDANMDKNS